MKAYLAVAVFFLALSAQAQTDDPINGSDVGYLPEDQLVPGVCKLVAKNYFTRKQQITDAKRKLPIGEAEITNEENHFFCSGSIIAENEVLTAAHCNLWTEIQNRANSSVYEDKIPKQVKRIIGGNEVIGMPEGCTDKNWTQSTYCYTTKIFRESFGFTHLEAQCVSGKITSDGKREYEALPIYQGDIWPNPLYAPARNEYDSMLMRTRGKFSITPYSMVLDAAESHDLLVRNSSTCRVFGYGLDRRFKDEHGQRQAGRYHGARIPLTRISPKQIVITDPDHFIFFGDSGGPILCKDDTGTDRIFGVVSRGNPVRINPFEYKMNELILSPMSFHQDWIEYIQSDVKGSIPDNISETDKRNLYHSIALKYEMKNAEKIFNRISQCFQDKKRDMYPIPKQQMKQIVRLLSNDLYLMSKLEKVTPFQEKGAIRIYYMRELPYLNAVNDQCYFLTDDLPTLGELLPALIQNNKFLNDSVNAMLSGDFSFRSNIGN